MSRAERIALRREGMCVSFSSVSWRLVAYRAIEAARSRV